MKTLLRILVLSIITNALCLFAGKNPIIAEVLEDLRHGALELDLEDQKFEPKDIEKLAKVLPHTPTLKHLAFRNCALDDDMAITIMNAVARNGGLEEVILKDNFITNTCEHSLMLMMLSNKNLLKVDLSQNYISEHTIARVIENIQRIKKQTWKCYNKDGLFVKVSVEGEETPTQEESCFSDDDSGSKYHSPKLREKQLTIIRKSLRAQKTNVEDFY